MGTTSLRIKTKRRPKLDIIKTESSMEELEGLSDSLSDLEEKAGETFEMYADADAVADLQDEIDELRGRIRRYQLQALMSRRTGCGADRGGGQL